VARDALTAAALPEPDGLSEAIVDELRARVAALADGELSAEVIGAALDGAWLLKVWKEHSAPATEAELGDLRAFALSQEIVDRALGRARVFAAVQSLPDDPRAIPRITRRHGVVIRRVHSSWRIRPLSLTRSRPRPRGAGRPRARALSRSSSRGGDSGDDGPSSSEGEEDPPGSAGIILRLAALE
jgi:hypothetical protein